MAALTRFGAKFLFRITHSDPSVFAEGFFDPKKEYFSKHNDDIDKPRKKQYNKNVKISPQKQKLIFI